MNDAAKRLSTSKFNARCLTDAENEEARLALIVELVGSRKPSVVLRVLRQQADSLPDMSRHYCKAIIAALGNKEEATINELIHFVRSYLVTEDGAPPNADLTWDLDCRLRIFEGSPLDAELYRRLSEHIDHRWPHSAASLYYQGYSELVQDNADAANNSWTTALHLDSAFWLAAWELGGLRTTEKQWRMGAAYFHRALAQEGSHRVFKLTLDAATCFLLANDMTGFPTAVRAAADGMKQSCGEHSPDAAVLAQYFEGLWLPEDSEMRAKLSRALADEFSARWPGSDVATHVKGLLSEVADGETEAPIAEPTTSTITRADRERRYWLWVTGPDYYLDDRGRECLEEIDTWSCARDTRAGDLVLLYRTTLNDTELNATRRRRGDPPVGRDIAYLIRAEGEAYPCRDWGWGCKASTLFVLRNPVPSRCVRCSFQFPHATTERADLGGPSGSVLSGPLITCVVSART